MDPESRTSVAGLPPPIWLYRAKDRRNHDPRVGGSESLPPAPEVPAKFRASLSSFIDSTGMSVAYRLERWGREPGRSPVFIRPIPDVLHKLEVTGLAEQLRFTEPDGAAA